MRSAGCFLFSLLSMFVVLYVSAASRFSCVAILDLYFSEYLQISSLTIGIPRSLRMSSFLTYHGVFTIILRIFALCSIVECLFLKPNWCSGISFLYLYYCFYPAIYYFFQYFGKYWMQ